MNLTKGVLYLKQNPAYGKTLNLLGYTDNTNINKNLRKTKNYLKKSIRKEKKKGWGELMESCNVESFQ